jgi:hypothetical protein
VERHIIIDHLKFTYEGLCNAPETFALIQEWFNDKGYDWVEKKNQEITTSEGKQLHMVLEPYKNISDYYKLVIKITLNFINLKSLEVEFDGKTIQSQRSTIRMMIDAYVVSDRKQQWHDKPIYWLLSQVLEKYFFKNHFRKAEIWLRSDVDDLMDKFKDYLNTYKYMYQN